MKTCKTCGESKALDCFYGAVKKSAHCKPCFRQRCSDNYRANREARLDQQRLYRAPKKVALNKARTARAKAAYWAEPEKHRAKFRVKVAAQRRNNWRIGLATVVRNRMAAALRSRGIAKRSDFASQIGCSWDELRAHLEAGFLPGMSWENRGLWHIDHIVPLASAASPEEMLALCHYTNLQPLWAADNLRKGARAA